MSHTRFWLLALLLASLGPTAHSQLSFEPPTVYPLYQEAKTVAVGDLNGDGRDDVAVTAWPSGLYALYQQADGLLGTPATLMAPTLPLGLAIGDLNGDLRMDLAVGGAGGQIFLYRQGSSGSLGLPAVCAGYGLVNSLVIDDLNGDGLADIADTSFDFPVALVSLQATDGTFGLPAVYQVGGSNARSICTLDCNSDGRRDVALLLADQACYLTGSPGGFDLPHYIPAQWAYALAAGDVTGDGSDDLVFTVATNQPDAAIGVIPFSGGLPGSSTLYPAYDFAQPLVVADMNTDGRKDVIAVHGGYEAVTVHLQDGAGSLGPWSAYTAPYCNGYEAGGLAVGDLNSDGLPDVAIADWWNGLVVVLHTPNQGPPPDTTAPVCAAVVTGESGRDGWYISAVTVALSAEDNEGGSGVAEILYALDGVTWSSYSAPIVIAAQGTTPVSYCAEDSAGNRSDAQQVQVKVDTAAPSLTVEPLITTIWPPNGEAVDVPVRVTAADTTSGIAELLLAVGDEYELLQWESAVAPGATVAVPLVASRRDDDPDGRVYTLVITGADAAGNAAAATTTVTVPRSHPPKPDKPKKPK